MIGRAIEVSVHAKKPDTGPGLSTATGIHPGVYTMRENLINAAIYGIYFAIAGLLVTGIYAAGGTP